MHIFISEYQIANPFSTKDDRMKEILKNIHSRLIIQGKDKKRVYKMKSSILKACGVQV